MQDTHSNGSSFYTVHSLHPLDKCSQFIHLVKSELREKNLWHDLHLLPSFSKVSLQFGMLGTWQSPSFNIKFPEHSTQVDGLEHSLQFDKVEGHC